MKVQLVVKTSSKLATTSTTIKAIVGPAETPLDVQERIGSVMNTLCFPDQKLAFNGKLIPEDQSMSACGIKDGDVLELLIQASEETFCKQLSEILGTQAVPLEELSLLFSYRHSVSVKDALMALGYYNGDFKAFVDGQKCLSCDGALMKVARAQKTPQVQKAPEPLTDLTNNLSSIPEDKVRGPIGVKVAVEIHVPDRAPVSPSYNDDEDDMELVRLEPSDTVARAKEIIAASEQIPFPARELLLGGKKLEDGLTLHEAGVTNGALLIMVVHASVAALVSQLEELLVERVGLAANDLSLLYCQRFGTPVCQALRSLGLPGNYKRFLEGQSEFCLKGGCVTLTSGPELTTPPSRVDEESQ